VALCALALPAVAFAAVITVSGTSGDDLVSIRAQGQDSARVALNGAQVASASSGDTIDLTTGRGDDTMIFDEVEDFDLAITVNSRLGRGDDVAVISGVNDSQNETPSPTAAALQIDLGSGHDRWGLHNYGDTNRLVVNAGPGNDSGTATRSGFVDSRFNDTFRLGSGHDRMSWISINQTGDFAVRADSGNDRVRVTSLGFDRMWGGPGNDQFHSRDGNADAITCGPGNDTVRADRSDSVSSSCERVRRS
jgi:hypothetical protein